MEEGDLEGLATTVPQELVEYVLQDNAAFTVECAEWDKAQELRKKQEALMVKKQQQPETAVADSSNDIEVSCTHFVTSTVAADNLEHLPDSSGRVCVFCPKWPKHLS